MCLLCCPFIRCVLGLGLSVMHFVLRKIKCCHCGAVTTDHWIHNNNTPPHPPVNHKICFYICYVLSLFSFTEPFSGLGTSRAVKSRGIAVPFSAGDGLVGRVWGWFFLLLADKEAREDKGGVWERRFEIQRTVETGQGGQGLYFILDSKQLIGK